MAERTQSYGTGFIVVVAAIGLFLVLNLILWASGVYVDKDGESLHTMKILGIMLAAGLSLAMYSFLYADNPVFKFAEHLYIGVSVGYLITTIVYEQILPLLIKPLFNVWDKDWKPENLHLIVPLCFGMCMFARFIPKIAWVSRYAFALIVGYGAGLAIPSVILAILFKQSQATMINLVSSPNWFDNLSNIILFIGVITVLIYFFFSIKHEGPIKPVAKTGTYFIMISFGASFGFTVMARISLLIGHVMYLLVDWLHVTSPPGT